MKIIIQVIIFTIVIYATAISQNTLNVEVLLGSNKAVFLNGIKSGDLSGWFVDNAKDINRDGIDDLVIGARFASPKNRTMAGQTYILFGNNIQNVDLEQLDELRLGFTIDGKTATFNGYSVGTAGDIDSDGFNDILIGARDGRPLDRAFSGEAYLIFGSNFIGNRDPIEASDIDSPTGITFYGAEDGDFLGNAVSQAGDFNNDGFDDFLIAAVEAKDSNNTQKAGKTYLIFGDKNVKNIDTLDLLNFNSEVGIEFVGNYFGGLSGYALGGGGDINGDGFDDIIITAIGAKRSDNNLPLGECYVILGNNRPSLTPVTLDTDFLDGNSGFKITGMNEAHNFGFSTAILGDINKDGLDDFIISEIGTAAVDGEEAPPSGEGIGKAYIIFGSPNFLKEFDLLSINGDNGFIINGKDKGYFTGWSVNDAGDVNGDGINDLIIGAPGADPNGIPDAGEVYIVYGRDDFDQFLDLDKMTTAEGLTIEGYEQDSFFGWSVSGAGDTDNDGFDEVIIGTPFASPGNKKNAGRTYIIFLNKDEDRKSPGTGEGISNKIIIYPNPSPDNYVNLTFELNKTSDIEIDIYDTLGRKIRKTLILNEKGPGKFNQVIPAKSLANGIYIVKVLINNEISIGKFFILK